MTTQAQSPRRLHGDSASRRASAGVTLIELMIAVAIVGILTAIAYPSYQSYIARTNRGAAASCLLQYAQFMERYYTTNLTYVDAEPELGCSTENDLNRRYTIELDDDLTQGTYTLTATPTQLQTRADTQQCGVLTLDQTGARTPTTGCW